MTQLSTRFALDLECPDEIRQCARTLAEQAEECGLTTGVHPAGFAATCLLQSGQEQGKWVTQSDVAETGNVTPTMVRTHHETLDELAV
jgi:transcription initiation factor TFIIB